MGATGSKVTEKDVFGIIRRQSEQIDQLIAQNLSTRHFDRNGVLDAIKQHKEQYLNL